MSFVAASRMEKCVSDGKDGVIGVFAHNEQCRIIHCLESLSTELQNPQIEIFVLANGCTDQTEVVVEAYARSHSNVHLVHIPLGDKANAWNYFVHEVAPASELVYFMDGDVE